MTRAARRAAPLAVVAAYTGGEVEVRVTSHRGRARTVYAVRVYSAASGVELSPVTSVWRSQRCAELEARAIATGADIVTQLEGQVIE